MRTNVLHIQFEFLFHFEMNRCFCVDETQGMVHTTSCTRLVSSGCSQWEQNEIKRCPAKSTVVACDGHRVHILSWASSTNEHQLKGWLVQFWKIWGCKVRWRLQWQREGWVYQVSGNRKHLFSFLLFPDLVSLLVYHSFLICFNSNPEKGLLG